MSSPLSCRHSHSSPRHRRRLRTITWQHVSQNSPNSSSTSSPSPTSQLTPPTSAKTRTSSSPNSSSAAPKAKLLTDPALPIDVPPVVYGEIKTPGARRTIVFYAHYDGQPVTPSEWDTGQPFTPIIKQVDGEPRIYARGAGDDKAAIFAQLTALSALQAAHIPLKANIRFVWEGEEEAGSAHLEQILMANRDLIHGDIWLVCDGPVDQTRRQTLIFGARGDAHLQITVYGPNRSLHSGHYGNWAPNPAMMLAQLLAGMKDANGRVLIPHFYDGIAPLGPIEKQALANAPVNDEFSDRSSPSATPTAAASTSSNSSTNHRSTSTASPPARPARTPPTRSRLPRQPISTSASSSASTGKTQQQRVIDYVRTQGYFITSAPPTREELLAHPMVAFIQADPGEDASRTPIDIPIAADVIKAVESARGKVILLPTFGGTVPWMPWSARQTPAPSPSPSPITTTTSTPPTKTSACKTSGTASKPWPP